MRPIMRCCCGLLIAFAMLLHPVASIQVAQAQASLGNYVPGELLVKLHLANDLSAILAQYNLTLADQFGARPIYRLGIAGGAAPPTKAAALALDSRVAAAEPNYIGQTPE